jgi:hypothetical protein
MIFTNKRKNDYRLIKVVIAESLDLLDKLDDALDGIVVDDNAFHDGWFAVREIKSQHKPKDKVPKEPDENN